MTKNDVPKLNFSPFVSWGTDHNPRTQNRDEIADFDEFDEGLVPFLHFVEWVQSIYASTAGIKDEELFLRCEENTDSWTKHLKVVRIWDKKPEELEAARIREQEYRKASAAAAYEMEMSTYLKLKEKFEGSK